MKKYLFVFSLLISILFSCKQQKKEVSRFDSLTFKNVVYEYAETSNPLSCVPDDVPFSMCLSGFLYMTNQGTVVWKEECIGSGAITYYLGTYVVEDTAITCTFKKSYLIPVNERTDTITLPADPNKGALSLISPVQLKLMILSCKGLEFYSLNENIVSKPGMTAAAGKKYWKADSAACKRFLDFACRINAFAEIFPKASALSSKEQASVSVAACTKTILDFLHWYKDNLVRLNDIPVVLNLDSKDTTLFYGVDFPATAQYLGELKKSGFVSDRFQDSLKTYFSACNSELLKHPQKEGAPYGFEIDLIMNSRYFDDNLARLNEAKVLSQEAGEKMASIIIRLVDGQKLHYNLSKEGNRWLIDKIVLVEEK